MCSYFYLQNQFFIYLHIVALQQGSWINKTFLSRRSTFWRVMMRSSELSQLLAQCRLQGLWMWSKSQWPWHIPQSLEETPVTVHGVGPPLGKSTLHHPIRQEQCESPSVFSAAVCPQTSCMEYAFVQMDSMRRKTCDLVLCLFCISLRVASILTNYSAWKLLEVCTAFLTVAIVTFVSGIYIT